MKIALSPNVKLLQQEISNLITLNQNALALPFRLYPYMKEDFRKTFKQYQNKITAATIQIKQHIDYLQKGYIANNILLSLLQRIITSLCKTLKQIIRLSQAVQVYYAQ